MSLLARTFVRGLPSCPALELRTGSVILRDRTRWQVTKLTRVKPGKGPAYIQASLKAFGDSTSKTVRLRTSEQVDGVWIWLPAGRPLTVVRFVAVVDITRRPVRYLFTEDNRHVFMTGADVDPESGQVPDELEQLEVPDEVVGRLAPFLRYEVPVTLLLADDVPVGIRLPDTVTEVVVHTELAHRDRAAGGCVSVLVGTVGTARINARSCVRAVKPATLSNGLVVKVPVHISHGDAVVVRTTDGTYVSKAPREP